MAYDASSIAVNFCVETIISSLLPGAICTMQFFVEPISDRDKATAGALDAPQEP
jgi:hypothetical protein